MKKYYAGHTTKRTLEGISTEKAFCFEYDLNGFGKCKPLWIPKSICKISEENEVGNIIVFIPQWFFIKNRLEYMRVRGLCWLNGKDFVVEM